MTPIGTGAPWQDHQPEADILRTVHHAFHAITSRGRPGILRGAWRLRATDQRMSTRLRVEAAEPPHRFAFRWDYPDGEQPHQGNAPLVEFTLTAEGTGTRLRVTESGFTALQKPDQDKTTYIDIHDKGWDIHLANLQRHVTRQA